MKRSIPKSMLARPRAPETKSATGKGEGEGQNLERVQDAPKGFPSADREDALLPARGAGSAWKSGALAQAQSGLERTRGQIADDVLNGRHEIALSPEKITDPLGSDRREDWMDQPAFLALVESIRKNGQDTPVQVWPRDAGWRPDAIDPTNPGETEFVLLTGRRRHAAARQLGIKLRAVLAPTDKRDERDHRFEMLFIRFRENEEREDLSAFERLQSIGEMYESLKSSSQEKLTAVAFAERIGVHESMVSRGRAVFRHRDQLLQHFKARGGKGGESIYDLSFGELQKLLSESTEPTASGAAAEKPKTPQREKVEVSRKLGKQRMVLALARNNLSIKVGGMALNKKQLEGLGDVIADYLANQAGSKNP